MLNHFSIPKESFNGPVLITGAGGCIGAWTTAMLLKANIEVIKISLKHNISYFYFTDTKMLKTQPF